MSTTIEQDLETVRRGIACRCLGYSKQGCACPAPPAIAALDRIAAELARRDAVQAQLTAQLEAFAGAAEAAIAHAERARGGQQVPFHGDFAGSPPSVIGRLRWWAREYRAALAAAKGAP